jgi:hypothetical protein
MEINSDEAPQPSPKGFDGKRMGRISIQGATKELGINATVLRQSGSTGQKTKLNK